MTNTLKLKALLLETGYTQQKLASKLGISVYSLHKKINNKVEFKVSEIEKISSLLGIVDKDKYFFIIMLKIFQQNCLKYIEN